MVSTSFPVKSQIQAAKRADYETLIRFVPLIFGENYYSGFFHGQLTIPSAKETWKQIIGILSKNARVLPKTAHQKSLMRNLPGKLQLYDFAQGSYPGYASVMLVDAGGLTCKER